MFGDDSQDYDAALQRHYEQRRAGGLAGAFRFGLRDVAIRGRISPKPGRTTCISSIRSRRRARSASESTPAIDKEGAHSARLDFDPYVAGTIEQIVDAWTPFVVAMNSVNRAMGRPDLYPFVLAPAVVEKLRFVHDLVRPSAERDDAAVEAAFADAASP